MHSNHLQITLHYLWQKAEGSPITDGLTKAGDTLASETREPRPVRPDELTAKQLSVIRNERTKRGCISG